MKVEEGILGNLIVWHKTLTRHKQNLNEYLLLTFKITIIIKNKKERRKMNTFFSTAFCIINALESVIPLSLIHTNIPLIKIIKSIPFFIIIISY